MPKIGVTFGDDIIIGDDIKGIKIFRVHKEFGFNDVTVNKDVKFIYDACSDDDIKISVDTTN
jgi:hypothetical protein